MKNLMNKTDLYCDEEVYELIDKNKVDTNGCGAGITALLIPNKWLGLDFTICCHIHDAYYQYGKTLDYKAYADRIFLNNMLRVVSTRPKLLRPLGRVIAYGYYEAVVKYGGVAYWSGKNEPRKLIKEIVKVVV